MYEGNTISKWNKLSKNWGEKHTWSDNSRDLLVLSAITVKSKLVSARQQHAITQHNTITRTAVQQHMNPCKKKDSLNFNTIYLRGVISRYFWEIFVSKKEVGVIYELSTRQQPVEYHWKFHAVWPYPSMPHGNNMCPTACYGVFLFMS